MPHIIIKLWPGKTKEQKALLADRIVKDAMEILGSSEKSLSIDFQEVKEDEWSEKVYRPEIQPKLAKLYKKPGYEM